MQNETVTTIAARDNFSELVNKVAYGNKRVILTRRGKPVGAFVSLNDLTKIQKANTKLNEYFTLLLETIDNNEKHPLVGLLSFIGSLIDIDHE